MPEAACEHPEEFVARLNGKPFCCACGAQEFDPSLCGESHCACWYEGEPCCYCGIDAEDEAVFT